MKYELKTTCDFGEVWDEMAPKGASPDLMARPAKEVGHYYIRHNGRSWQSVYLPDNEFLKSPRLTAEMNRVYRYLLEELFPGSEGLEKLREHCSRYPAAIIGGGGGDYNFYINGKYVNFWVQAATRSSDCHLCIHVFAK